MRGLDWFLLFGTALAGLTLGGEAAAANLRIAAAASLRDALEPLAAAFERSEPGVKAVLVFAGSGTLEQQILNGARVDVFFSAAASYMDTVEKRGLLLDESRRDVLGNRLVLIARVGQKPAIRDAADLPAETVKTIAISDPKSVPAGRYAKEALSALGLYEALRPKLIRLGDVRQVLAAVESGNADAGFVYASDAMASRKIRVILRIDPRLHSPIVYPIAVLKDAPEKRAALRFVDFISGAEARVVFERCGFEFLGGAP